jgi:PIN domain nuclease of toxin-antitoxin system
VKILLDTHILLWWLNNDPLLSERLRKLIRDPENTIFISAIALWEIWLKQSLGKLKLPSNFKELLELEEFENLPLTARQAAAVASLPWHHRDPFDRMLVAQAQVERLTLLSMDEHLLAYGSFVFGGN